MQTNIPITNLIEGLPDEIVYQLFKIVIKTKYLTLPGFFTFISNSCLAFDPFTGICASIIGNSELGLKYEKGISEPRMFLNIQGEVDLITVSSYFSESPIFISFVEVLTRFHMKFQKLIVENPEKNQIFSVKLKSSFEMLENSNFVKSCCKGLFYLDKFYFPDLVSRHSEIVKALITDANNLIVLPKLLNLELLTVVFSNSSNDDVTKRLKEWIQLVSGIQIKRTITIEFSDSVYKVSDLLIQLIIEITTEHKLIDIKIYLDKPTVRVLKDLRPVQDHISSINLYNVDRRDPFTCNLLNSYTSLSKVFGYSFDEGFIECLDNKRIRELHTLAIRRSPTPIEEIKNAKNLKTLRIYTDSTNFSGLKRLKVLYINFVTRLDTEKSLLLPPNLAKMSFDATSRCVPNSCFEICNRDQLRNLRTVYLTLAISSEGILKLLGSLPLSVTSLSLHLNITRVQSSRPTLSFIKLDFGYLINLERVKILGGVQLWPVKLEIPVFSEPLKALDINLGPSVIPIIPEYLPNNLQQVSVHLFRESPGEFFMNCNMNHCKKLSHLSVNTGYIKHIDLRKIIPNAVLYFKLSMRPHQLGPLDNGMGPTKNSIIQLPFDSHPNLKYLQVEFVDPFEVSFEGEVRECDKAKLRVINISHSRRIR